MRHTIELHNASNDCPRKGRRRFRYLGALPAAAFFLLLIVNVAVASNGGDYEIAVDGLACPFCAYGIEKHLLRIDSVEKVEVDVAAGRVLLWVEPGTELPRDRVDRAIDDAGFELKAFGKADDET